MKKNETEGIEFPPGFNDPKEPGKDEAKQQQTEEKQEESIQPVSAGKIIVKTHWKKLKNPNYLGSYDFQPKEERIVTIDKVTVGAVKNTDGAEADCIVVHFIEKYKPMLLNSTNGKTLTKLFETPYIEEWHGKSFKLVVKPIKAFGEIVDALRVKNEKVTRPTPTLQIGTKQFTACKERYAKDKSVLEKIKATFIVSPEVEATLIA